MSHSVELHACSVQTLPQLGKKLTSDAKLKCLLVFGVLPTSTQRRAGAPDKLPEVLVHLARDLDTVPFLPEGSGALGYSRSEGCVESDDRRGLGVVPIVVDVAGRVLASGDPGSKACRATRGTTPSTPAGSRGEREVDGPGRLRGALSVPVAAAGSRKRARCRQHRTD